MWQVFEKDVSPGVEHELEGRRCGPGDQHDGRYSPTEGKAETALYLKGGPTRAAKQDSRRYLFKNTLTLRRSSHHGTRQTLLNFLVPTLRYNIIVAVITKKALRKYPD